MITRDLSDGRPLAALDGEVPDCVFVALSYRKLAAETTMLIQRLQPLGDDRSSFLAMEGRLHLAVLGLEDDAREICEVPEVANFMKAILQAVPGIAWYLAMDHDLPTMGLTQGVIGPSSTTRAYLLAGCVERLKNYPVIGQQIALTSNEHYASRIEGIVQGLGAACTKHKVPERRFQQRFRQLANLLGFTN